MSPPTEITDPRLLEAQRLSGMATQALVFGAIGVPVLALMALFAMFSGPMGENGVSVDAYVLLFLMFVTLVMSPVLAVRWSGRSYELERSARQHPIRGEQ